ncbi:MAG: peptide chain release factor 2 [Ruminococcus sp.]|jgi:peptide chain release factor 2|nr:peptide chain release factor 2 [Ruminococcus sp.]
MVILDELKVELENYRKDVADLYNILGIESAKERIAELNEISSKDGFWNDTENSSIVMKEVKQNENKIAQQKKLSDKLEDTITMLEMIAEENPDDEDSPEIIDIKNDARRLKKEIDAVKLSTLLTGEYDGNNAIVTFHAGAGGTEAQDWAQMLFRMYNMWAESHGYKVTTLDYLDGEEAGLKTASVLVEGTNAYGFLKSENGVHRLVRISPFDSSGRRHTSFASLEVMPEITDEDNKIDIRPEDLEIDFFRASGAGGQKVNKTSSAVRLTHVPTGIVVSCQTQRSQYQNKDFAMKMLISKLVEIKEREHLERVEDIKGVQKEIAWGAQIRSYVFMPYTLAKDHRTGVENGNINAVMDGDLDDFINGYLTALSKGELK